MRDSMALESLTQRGRSPFYNELVSLYQESQDAVSELPNASNGDVTLTLRSIHFKERLRAIVQKHMGIVLDNVVVNETTKANLMCLVGTSDTTSERKKNHEATAGMMVEEINRLYNDKTGYLDQSSATGPLPYRMSFMVTTSMWLMKDDHGQFFFSADELAAASLHELGHIDHFIRAGRRVYGRTLDAAEIVDYVQVHPDRELILYLIAKLKQSKYLSQDYAHMLKITEDYFRTNNAIDDPFYMESLTTLLAVVVAERAAWQLSIFNNLLGSGRDRVGTNNHMVESERSADEFAVRHGAYKSLLTMVAKYQSLGEDKHYVYGRLSRSASVSLVIGLCKHFTSMFKMGAEEVNQGYDPIMRRLELMVQTAKHAFSDPGLPSDVKSELHEQIQQCEEYLTQYKSAPHRRARAQFKTWKDNVLKLGRLVSAPFQNRLTGDYERLQNATRSLSRHPLYYLANKR
jgi:hypothetical protein